MNKRLVMLVALLAVVAIAVPAMAVEFKYGGMYRLRWQSNDNLVYGSDNTFRLPNDNQNYMDQRLRMYFTFVGSENLQVVTKFEVDTIWGNGFDKFSSGGAVGADSINLETKNVYVDFNVPYTPVRSTLGVQGISLLTGWMVDDDFSAAMFSAKFDPIRVSVGYIAGLNNNVTTTQDNIDDFVVSVNYAEGPFKAALVGLFQDAHDTDTSTFFNPRMSTGSITQGSAISRQFLVPTNAIVTGLVNDNMLFDLGFNFEYKIDWVRAYINFVKNFGSYDLLGVQSIDYTGYMIDAGASFYYGPFTFNLAGFLASGDNLDATENSDGNFRYPRGASHYWSEIMGLGSLDQQLGGAYLNAAGGVNQRTTRTGDQLNDAVKNLPGFQGYQAADIPSNLWMVNFGIAYQALEKTKLTFNYYYIGTQVDVLANFRSGKTDNSIGHEIDFYIDQGIVDGLNLRIVGAYLIANDGYTVLPSNWESDAWKAGMVLQWHF